MWVFLSTENAEMRGDVFLWVLGTGFWVLGSGFWVLGTGYWVLGTGYWVDYRRLGVNWEEG